MITCRWGNRTMTATPTCFYPCAAPRQSLVVVLEPRTATQSELAASPPVVLHSLDEAESIVDPFRAQSAVPVSCLLASACRISFWLFILFTKLCTTYLHEGG